MLKEESVRSQRAACVLYNDRKEGWISEWKSAKEDSASFAAPVSAPCDSFVLALDKETRKANDDKFYTFDEFAPSLKGVVSQQRHFW